MHFEIDVSGFDIFEKNYTIVVAEKEKGKLLLGYKFTERTIGNLRSRFGQGKYNKCPASKSYKSGFKVRLYCIVIYHLFREIKRRNPKMGETCLDICRDFDGRENQIRQSLRSFLCDGLGISTPQDGMHFQKLPRGSIADTYAHLLRKDVRNKFSKHVIEIHVDEFEKLLKK